MEGSSTVLQPSVNADERMIPLLTDVTHAVQVADTLRAALLRHRTRSGHEARRLVQSGARRAYGGHRPTFTDTFHLAPHKHLTRSGHEARRVVYGGERCVYGRHCVLTADQTEM